MKYIEIGKFKKSCRKGVVLVSDEDFKRVNELSWSFISNDRDYVVTTIKSPIGRKRVMMARFILNAPDGMVVDHINGDCLDNRRENLRIVTYAKNSQNRDIPSNNTTGFKGIRVIPNGRWRAAIMSEGVYYNLGTFPDKFAAAKAYNEAARKFHGESARLNPL